MNIDSSISLFCAWLAGLYGAGPGAAGADEVRHHEKIRYAGPTHPNLVLEAFSPPPGRANGRGLICVISGGFFSGPFLLSGMSGFMRNLAAGSGYTVFAVTHASQGDAVIGDMAAQVRRAVRFIRHEAGRFGIDPKRIGIMGFSSGGYMALAAGVLGDDGLATSTDPVERTSSRVQAVVAFFAPTDFLNYGSPDNINLGSDALHAFSRALLEGRPGLTHEERKVIARSISPRYDVSAEAAPTLLIHGTKDRLVPFQQSQVFYEAMRQAGAQCRLRAKEGAGHGWPEMQTDLNAALAWFDYYLGGERARGEQASRDREYTTNR